VKFGHVVFKLSSGQTDKQRKILIPILQTPPQGEERRSKVTKKLMQSYQHADPPGLDHRPFDHRVNVCRGSVMDYIATKFGVDT